MRILSERPSQPARFEMQRFVIANGSVAPNGAVSIDADDEGLLLGCSVFETLRTYDGHLFGVDAHLELLVASCDAMDIRMPDEDRLVHEMVGAASEISGNRSYGSP